MKKIILLMLAMVLLVSSVDATFYILWQDPINSTTGWIDISGGTLTATNNYGTKLDATGAPSLPDKWMYTLDILLP